jgi:ABC-type cobalamin/Fe3+-siderophores transport system ATPase subunit
MVENISLVKQVHHFMSVKDSAKMALEYLSVVSCEHLANKEVDDSSELELFYVKFIRALLSDGKNIVILTPYRILEATQNMDEVINNLLKYNSEKKVTILDLVFNEHRYKGSS